jgi:hypothetical protein
MERPWSDDADRASLPSSYTFDLSVEVQDFPRLWINNLWGITILRWDIFAANWTDSAWSYPLTPGQNGYVGSATGFANAESQYSFDPAFDDETNVFAFPVQDEWRTPGSYYHEFWWLGRLADGTQIKPGSYQMRVAALAPFGNPSHSDNWDIFAHTFTVVAKA